MTAVLRLSGLAITFLATAFYARVLGPEDMGIFSFVLTCATVLTIPAALGLPTLVLRLSSKEPQVTKALSRWADIRIVLSGLAAASLLVTASFLPEAHAARWLFILVAPLPLITNLGSIRRSLLQAQGRVAKGAWPDLVLSRALTLAGVFLWWICFGDFEPVHVLVALLASTFIATTVNHFQSHALKIESQVDTRPGWSLRQALPLMWLGGISLLLGKVDLLMIGGISGAEQAGIYAVSSKSAELFLILGLTANSVVSPKVSRLYQEGRIEDIKTLLGSMARRVLLITLPPALIVIIFAEPVLSLLYGEPFARGAVVLQILGAAQMLVVAGGSMGMLLTMTGHERQHLHALVATLVINIALNAVLIPHYGAAGGASATCMSLIMCRLMMAWMVKQHLHFRMPFLGI